MIQLCLCEEYEREMTQCPESQCVPANSSQCSGFIEFDDKAPHVFSGPMDRRLHRITRQQGREQRAVTAPPA